MISLEEVVSESLIRQITRECQRVDAINLAQAYPDYDTKDEIKNLAIQAIEAGHNQYSHTWGAPVLREAIAEKYRTRYGIRLDPEENILVTCGCMEALRIALNVIIRNFGRDTEILMIEPYYESFVTQTLLEGGVPRFVSLAGPNYDLDIEQIERKITENTKALLINSPQNPNGKVYTHDELAQLHELCVRKNIYLLSDETYEHIIYGNRQHIPILSFDNSNENLMLAFGLGKTYAITGWRIGYLIAGKSVIKAIRPSHDYNTVCAPTPLQHAAANLLKFPDSYYDELRAGYEGRRRFLLPALEEVGFKCFDPQGAYYILADFSEIGKRVGISNDIDFMFEFLIPKIGVGAVPGTAFYHNKEQGKHKIRFTFSKQMDTLIKARDRLLKLADLF